MALINKLPINLLTVARAIRLMTLPVLCGWLASTLLELSGVQSRFAILSAVIVAAFVANFLYGRDFPSPP